MEKFNIVSKLLNFECKVLGNCYTYCIELIKSERNHFSTVLN